MHTPLSEAVPIFRFQIPMLARVPPKVSTVAGFMQVGARTV